MGGFLRFLVFFALLAAGFVLVALPLLLGPFLANMVRDAGLRADSVNVNVGLFDPGLVVGRAREITLNATNVDLAPARIGSLQLTLGGVEFFDRTFDTVSGDLNEVQLTLGNDLVNAASATVDGSGTVGEASITARFAPAQVKQLLTIAAAHNGLTLDDVSVTNSGVMVTIHGIELSAKLSVRGGALVLDPGVGGERVLLQPQRSDLWRLTDVWFTPAGMNMSGTVDVTRIVGKLSGSAQ